MRGRGFTLIELVVTLLVLAILTLAISGFISMGADGYVSTVQRERLQTKARFVIARMAQELRHAVPNSIDVSGNCVSFYPNFLSGFYTDIASSSVDVVSRPGDASFWMDSSYVDGAGIAIGFGVPSQFATAALVNGAGTMVSASTPINLPTSGSVSTTSPAERIYLFSEQVQFCLRTTDSVLVRVGDGVSVTDAVPVLSRDVVSAAFSVEGGGLNSNGLVNFYIELQDDRTGETAKFNHSVQVLNVL
ncbi:type II secretion system protein [Thaumasiovibrio subtropicus]|uniref:type II secretion system protein n=1 Tax=Thaumasiovibrio subtropicus TaxID=1891207 RepID=UPI000B35FB0F|nr:type II secretion system protein [Thaumasiovibrio subtropicus]